MTGKAKLVEKGEACGILKDLICRDPDNFKAGKLHNNYLYWEEVSRRTPFAKRGEILEWISNNISIAPYFRHFKGKQLAKVLNPTGASATLAGNVCRRG